MIKAFLVFLLALLGCAAATDQLTGHIIGLLDEYAGEVNGHEVEADQVPDVEDTPTEAYDSTEKTFPSTQKTSTPKKNVIFTQTPRTGGEFCLPGLH